MVRVYMAGESVMWRSSDVKSISLNLLARYKLAISVRKVVRRCCKKASVGSSGQVDLQKESMLENFTEDQGTVMLCHRQAISGMKGRNEKGLAFELLGSHKWMDKRNMFGTGDVRYLY